jgi:hypothetical protein
MTRFHLLDVVETSQQVGKVAYCGCSKLTSHRVRTATISTDTCIPEGGKDVVYQ